MGNPNARPKRGSQRRLGSSQSDTTNGSAVSPKTIPKRRTISSGFGLSNGIVAENGATTDLTETPLMALSIQEEYPTRPPLKFKSYKTGTLITNNGVPVDAIAAPIPPAKPSTEVSLEPAPKPSQLSATTPAFVPRTPQQPAVTSANVVSPTPITPAYQRVQNLLQEIRSPPSQGHRSQQVQQTNPYLSPPSSSLGTTLANATPSNQLPRVPNRPPRTYYQRIEKSKRDIIITADGVARNAVRVTERYLPNGTPYHNYTPEFEAPEYDFVDDFHAMSHKAKADLLANKQVEIVVQLNSYDEDENAKKAVTSKAEDVNGKGKEKAKKLGISKAADIQGKGQKKTDVKIKAEDTTTTVIDTLKALGPDFATNTKHLYITLDFLSILNPQEPTTPIPTGPRVTPLSHNGPLVLGANFTFLTNLVKTLQTFTGLKHMVVNLRVHSSHNPRPITIPQLTLILPFYDLGFTDWKVSYQTEFLSNSVPVKDHDYPLKWLDRERNKILREREKKLEDAVFTRRSSVDGKVATWTKK